MHAWTFKRALCPVVFPGGSTFLFYLELFVPGRVEITKAFVFTTPFTGYENARQAEFSGRITATNPKRKRGSRGDAVDCASGSEPALRLLGRARSDITCSSN
jgi:hypothetical protein